VAVEASGNYLQRYPGSIIPKHLVAHSSDCQTIDRLGSGGARNCDIYLPHYHGSRSNDGHLSDAVVVATEMHGQC
jgi:hypothetical protein